MGTVDMAGTLIHSLAKLRAKIPRLATTGIITHWQTAFKWTAACQAPRSSSKQNMRSVQACGNPLSNFDYCLWQSAHFIHDNPRSKHCRLARSAVHIWTCSLASEWNPAPAIFHHASPCLKSCNFLTLDFQSVKYMRSGLFRPEYSDGLSSHMFLVIPYL
jgi:hypothetical protein